MRRRTTVAVVGEGALANAVRQAFLTGEREFTLVPSAPDGPLPPVDLVVVSNDGWDTRSYASVRAECARRSVPWLPVRAELAALVIGPLEREGEQGCGQCAELRRGRARQDPEGHTAVMGLHARELAERPSPALSPLAVQVAAAIVADIAGGPLAGEEGRARRALLRVDPDTAAVSVHRFLPDPWCDVCGRLPDDSPERGRLAFAARPKSDPGNYRLGEIDLDHLVRTYVDEETGLIRSLRTGSDGGVATAVAPLGVRGKTGAPEYGFGRSRNYRTSRTTAILEGLERYGGGLPGGARSTVRATYRELADQALDPRSLGLHPEDHYRRPGFGLRPFDVDTPYDWVWGYSFKRQGPVLVPESCAYYRARHRSEPGFVYEISNGCALGSGLEEAILHGVLEVVERDAFLLTWYARMPVPRLDLASASDRRVPLLAEAISADTGYEVRVFDTTLEEGVPAVWAIALDTGERPGYPRAVCTAGAHPDPERAVVNALAELGPMVTSGVARYPGEAERAALMTRDPWQVKEMGDHELLYGNPAAFDRLDFLLTADTQRAFADAFPGSRIRNQDLGLDLEELTGRYLSSGLDVVVIDQTTPEHEVGGYRCVKTLIPGTLSMTFGHAYRRVDGLSRLLEMPHRLGHRNAPLLPHEINPHPHPFP
ncbi:TOMM precursor leader peptide-binding protein [Streptomyces sp. NPDC001568]|uniref:TOMM precursor leader peptide-binding protein n=1 Tax=Streptomyces sp. NPDC001568 TaxID=3364588 RepID=UPI0036B32113